MKSHIEVFNRREYKYVISKKQADQLLTFLDDKMVPDEHSPNREPYVIRNLYLDTRDRHLIRKSLDKPIYKQKIRMRSYYDFDDDAKVFLEIKKKYDGTVNKRRTKIKFGDAKEFIKTARIPELKKYHNCQVMRELAYVFKNYDLSPTTLISYNRIAMFGDDSDLRLTIDQEIEGESLETGEKTLLLPKTQRLLEIKSGRAIWLWLTNYLTANKIYRGGFSKYGKFHIYDLENNKVKERVCWTK
jgi:hypothetical protein